MSRCFDSLLLIGFNFTQCFAGCANLSDSLIVAGISIVSSSLSTFGLEILEFFFDSLLGSFVFSDTAILVCMQSRYDDRMSLQLCGADSY